MPEPKGIELEIVPESRVFVDPTEAAWWEATKQRDAARRKLLRIGEAADRYMALPVDASDRPESWQRLQDLLDAIGGAG